MTAKSQNRQSGLIIRRLIQRILFGLVTMLIVSIIIFVMTEVLPGDVAQAIMGQTATPEALAAIRDRLGLDEPPYIRYFYWLKGLVNGDLGYSLVTSLEVAELIGQRIGNTFLLAILTSLLALPLSIILGLSAAMRPGSKVDRFISSTTLSLISVPEFFIAAILVYFFAVKLRWLPALSLMRPGSNLIEMARSIVLPVSALTLTVLAHMSRMTRAAVISVLSSGYIETSILKGANKKRVILRHALPNALSPIINVAGVNLAYLISGVTVIETVFAFPGLGRLMVDAVQTRDMPLIQGCAMVFCAVYVGINLIVDLLSIYSNPRLRHPK